MKANLFNYPLFALGFRPFFALAALSAVFLMLLWNAIYTGKMPGNLYYHGYLWHAHEMLIGYTGAVIAGFLLTAVSNWTGRETLSGDKLAALCLLWLYGRLIPCYAGDLPDFLIALIDWLFIPLLALHLAITIIKAQQSRNMAFIVILFIIALGNALIHAELLALSTHSANLGVQLIIAAIILMILIIAGRIVPFFTERGLPGIITIRNPQLDLLAISSAIVMFSLQLFGVSGFWLLLAASAAAIINSMRIAGWYVQQIWYVPLLWILYLGYGWIIIGFGLSALSAYQLVDNTLVLHAYTLGGIGLLTLGMMARVSLGHTGRALKVSNLIAFAFLLLNMATLFRVILPNVFSKHSDSFIYWAGLCWLAAFALFLVTYLPMLVKPRIDRAQN